MQRMLAMPIVVAVAETQLQSLSTFCSPGSAHRDRGAALYVLQGTAEEGRGQLQELTMGGDLSAARQLQGHVARQATCGVQHMHRSASHACHMPWQHSRGCFGAPASWSWNLSLRSTATSTLSSKPSSSLSFGSQPAAAPFSTDRAMSLIVPLAGLIVVNSPTKPVSQLPGSNDRHAAEPRKIGCHGATATTDL
jgi:hypothetical protein